MGEASHSWIGVIIAAMVILMVVLPVWNNVEAAFFAEEVLPPAASGQFKDLLEKIQTLEEGKPLEHTFSLPTDFRMVGKDYRDFYSAKGGSTFEAPVDYLAPVCAGKTCLCVWHEDWEKGDGECVVIPDVRCIYSTGPGIGETKGNEKWVYFDPEPSDTFTLTKKATTGTCQGTSLVFS